MNPSSTPVLVSGFQEPLYSGIVQPLDEATLIEERRKRREAIKAKHRGQTTPMLVPEGPASNNEPNKLTSNSNNSGHQHPAPGPFHPALFYYTC